MKSQGASSTLVLAIVVMFWMFPTPAEASEVDEYMCKVVTGKWKWFSDHVAVSVVYSLVGPTSREYEVATGISMFGTPMGGRSRSTHISEISAYGVGAVHVRKADDGAPFKVCITDVNVDPVTIYDREF